MVTEERIKEALSHVIDPEINTNIVDLGFIYGIDIKDDQVNVDMTLTTKGCPLHQMLGASAKKAVEGLPGVKSANINLVWDPPWSPKMMSDSAKKKLGFSDDMIAD
ncbi:DUF59 domain-containing protein [bacterium]|nr:DUF59 domain-containing protein [FCB group bacterium]MBL7190295.1 DUF59 domain-containing protein [bacterium]